MYTYTYLCAPTHTHVHIKIYTRTYTYTHLRTWYSCFYLYLYRLCGGRCPPPSPSCSCSGELLSPPLRGSMPEQQPPANYSASCDGCTSKPRPGPSEPASRKTTCGLMGISPRAFHCADHTMWVCSVVQWVIGIIVPAAACNDGLVAPSPWPGPQDMPEDGCCWSRRK